MKPELNGWTLTNNSYQIMWYDGDQLLTHILKVLNSTSFEYDEEDENVGEMINGSDESEDDNDNCFKKSCNHSVKLLFNHKDNTIYNII